MPSSARDLTCGAAFGSALYSAGVFAPNIIIEQLQWTNLDMLRTFIVASGASALVFQIARSTGHASQSPRAPRNLGHFPFDGNILGGALVGSGMAITGACPGTALVQLSASLPIGRNVVAGGLFGGVIFESVWRLLNKPGIRQSTQSVLTVQIRGPWLTLAAWEAMCLLVVQGTNLIQPRSRTAAAAGLVSPVIGGLLIGSAQAFSMLVRKMPLGVSTAYEDFGRRVRGLVSEGRGEQSKSGWSGLALTPSIVFSMGIVAGAWLMAWYWPSPASNALRSGQQNLGFWSSFAGGCAMVLGARIAGGCTSGHGISGMSAFSVASMVTTASMFVVGTAIALMMR